MRLAERTDERLVFEERTPVLGGVLASVGVGMLAASYFGDRPALGLGAAAVIAVAVFMLRSARRVVVDGAAREVRREQTGPLGTKSEALPFEEIDRLVLVMLRGSGRYGGGGYAIDVRPRGSAEIFARVLTHAPDRPDLAVATDLATELSRRTRAVVTETDEVHQVRGA